eukprot:1160162-Pelagomonas_calceolata.AAC.4
MLPQVDQHWHNFGCDMCGVFPIVGPKYRSSIKDNYDLCKRCKEGEERGRSNVWPAGKIQKFSDLLRK